MIFFKVEKLPCLLTETTPKKMNRKKEKGERLKILYQNFK